MQSIAGQLQRIEQLHTEKGQLQQALDEAREEVEVLRWQLEEARSSSLWHNDPSYRGIGYLACRPALAPAPRFAERLAIRVPRPRRRPRRKRSVWLEFEEENTGVHYYYNQATGETTWDAPPHFEKADQHHLSSDPESEPDETEEGYGIEPEALPCEVTEVLTCCLCLPPSGRP